MKQKVLFIDRDGTLILEPPIDFQVDSLEKLDFYPKVFKNLSKIVEKSSFKLVMVTNQDGLGTDSFPEEDFIAPHNKMLKAFEGEGIFFDEILIDKSFPQLISKSIPECLPICSNMWSKKFKPVFIFVVPLPSKFNLIAILVSLVSLL